MRMRMIRKSRLKPAYRKSKFKAKLDNISNRRKRRFTYDAQHREAHIKNLTLKSTYDIKRVEAEHLAWEEKQIKALRLSKVTHKTITQNLYSRFPKPEELEYIMHL